MENSRAICSNNGQTVVLNILLIDEEVANVCCIVEQQRGPETINVLLIGHSYIRRLAEYMDSSEELENLGLPGVNVHCIGVSGGTLRQGRRCIRRALSTVPSLHPFVIFIHMGENDLGRISDGCIVSEVLRFVEYLQRISSCHVVIVSQVISFPQNRQLYRSSVDSVNTHLRSQLDSTHVFWHYESGLINGSASLFHRDRIHLSSGGMHRYWRSIRTAVGRVLRHNHPHYA